MLGALVAGSSAMAFQDGAADVVVDGSGLVIRDLTANLVSLLPDAGPVPADTADVPVSPDARLLGAGQVALRSSAEQIVVSVATMRTQRACLPASCRTSAGTSSRWTTWAIADRPDGYQVQVMQWRSVGSPHADGALLSTAQLKALANEATIVD